MPIENEVKYWMLPDWQHLVLPSTRIVQGYLSKNARVRMCINWLGYTNYVFTYKALTVGGVTEIETTISHDDYVQLIYTDQYHNQITKLRYSIFNGDERWDLDTILSQQDEVLAITAECEMPVGRIEPVSIPELIKPYINTTTDLKLSSYEMATTDVRQMYEEASDRHNQTTKKGA
jgi:hypothetical protein